jgi:O-phosphoseryl-tRNA(Cys) synthetase
MNTQQPEALRLADALDWLAALGRPEISLSAEELRRLHSVNAELLEVLQELLASERANSFEIVGRDTDGHPLNAAGVARVKARLVIAKAQG